MPCVRLSLFHAKGETRNPKDIKKLTRLVYDHVYGDESTKTQLSCMASHGIADNVLSVSTPSSRTVQSLQ